MDTATNWQPFLTQPADDSHRYRAHHAWQHANDWLGDYGIDLGTPDAFERLANDKWRFRIDGPRKPVEVVVHMSYDADSDGERYVDCSYAERVEVSRG